MTRDCRHGQCLDPEHCAMGGTCEQAKCVPTRNRATLIGAVHLFLTREDDTILLLRRANTGYHDGWYSVPAGHIDPGESAMEAMVREAAEEIGITVDPAALYLVHTMHRRSVTTDCTNSERVDFFFTAGYWMTGEALNGEPVNNEPHKCDEIIWHSIKPLHAKMVPYVRRALEYYQYHVPYSEMSWENPCPRCGSGGTKTPMAVRA